MGRFASFSDYELQVFMEALLTYEDAGYWDEILLDLMNELAEEKKRRGL